MTTLQASPPSPLSHAEVRSVIIGLMLAILLGALDQTIVSVALPKMSAELQGFELLAWVVSGYLVAVAVATPIYGKLGDLYGRRAMLSSAIAIFLIASVACALAQSMPMLVAARILQGLGGGGLISVAQATIADVVAPRDRGRFQGYISGAYAVASVCGPLAGGFLTAYLSWRWVFWINLPLGLAAFVISRRALARLPVPHVKRPVDYPGALLLSLGLSLLLIGITRIGQGAAWSEALNLQLFAVAAAALAAFLWQERRAIEPIIPLDLFRMPTVSICCGILFIAFFQIVSLSVLIPLRLQMMTEVGVEGSALQLIPLSLAIPFGAYVGGSLTARSGRFKRIQLSGALLVPCAVLGLALIDPRASIAGTLLMALTGLGIGSAVADLDGGRAERGAAPACRHRHRRHRVFPLAGLRGRDCDIDGATAGDAAPPGAGTGRAAVRCRNHPRDGRRGGRGRASNGTRIARPTERRRTRRIPDACSSSPRWWRHRPWR